MSKNFKDLQLENILPKLLTNETLNPDKFNDFKAVHPWYNYS